MRTRSKSKPPMLRCFCNSFLFCSLGCRDGPAREFSTDTNTQEETSGDKLRLTELSTKALRRHTGKRSTLPKSHQPNHAHPWMRPKEEKTMRRYQLQSSLQYNMQEIQNGLSAMAYAQVLERTHHSKFSTHFIRQIAYIPEKF
jgi:hypothetical protein